MSILKRKIFIAAMVVFSIIVGLAAIVNILQNKQTIAAAEEVANSSPDAGNVTAAEIITQIEGQLSEQGTSILAELRNEKQTYTQELGSADETRRVIVESLIASIDEAIVHYENNDYSSNNNSSGNNVVALNADEVKLKAGVAAIAAGFRARGWILASELMWFNLTNKQFEVNYYPTNGGRVAQSTQIKSVANNGEISLEYNFKSPGWLNGIFVDTIEGDAYNALGAFYYEKRYVGNGRVELSITDRYDWKRQDGNGMADKLMNFMFQAQEAEVVVPFYTKITLTVPGSAPFLWEYDDDGIKVTGFVGEVQTNIVPPEKIYDLRTRPQDSVTPSVLYLTAIDDGLYEGQSEITSVTFPDTIKRIGNRTFAGCSNLTGVSAMNNLTHIGEEAFSGCSELTNISAIDNLVYIGEGAFSGCSKLTTSFSLGVIEHIGDNAFNGCSLMPSVYIGYMLTYVGEGAFTGCNNLDISISSENAHYRSENNIVYDKNKSKVITSGNVPSVVTIPKSVTEIKKSAFLNKTTMTTLHIYGSPSIGETAFKNCQNLRNVYFYSFTLPTFGTNSFANDHFTMYSPHALREQYISRFNQSMVTASSIPITITLKDNDTTLDILNVYFGDVINIAKPVKIGYEFARWYSDKSLSGTVYTNGEYYTMTSDATFYAYFSANVYSVTFNSNGGVGGPSSISISTGEWLPKINSLPVKEWFLFDGYFDNEGVRHYYGNGEPTEYIWEKAENVTLYAHWLPNYYTVTYNNITFNGQIANFYVEDGAGSRCADKFVCGETLILSKVFPRFPTDSEYMPQMRFLGWYDSNGFTHRVNEARANITVYAKWRYDYNNLNRDSTYTITDDGAFNQGGNYDMIYIGFASNGLYNQLKGLKINSLSINLKVRLWEVYDGYQEIYVYGSSGSGNLLWSKTDIEHGGSGKSTNPAVYNYQIILPIEQLKNVDYLYFRYSAHGAGKDDWKTDKMYCELSYVVTENDIYGSNAPSFYWSYEDPFK